MATAAGAKLEFNLRSRLGLAVACTIAPVLALVLFPGKKAGSATSLRDWLELIMLAASVVSEWSAVYWLAQMVRRGQRGLRVAAALWLIFAFLLALLFFFLFPITLGSVLYPGRRLFGGT